MKVKIIYISKNPEFSISQDRNQWILSRKRTKRGEWVDRCYHPNLNNLLDCLAEEYFRRNSIKISELKELDKSILKVYKLNKRIGEALGKQF